MASRARLVTAFLIANSPLFVLIALPAHAAPPTAVVEAIDPLGDTFGMPAIPHDIARLDATVSSDAVTFVVDFHDAIEPPSAFSSRSVLGFLDIDIDQDSTSGALAKKSEFSPAGDSALGAEFHVDLFSERYHAGEAELVDTATSQSVGLITVRFYNASFEIDLPLELIGGDSLFNYGLIVGDFLDISDEAPNQGYASTVVPEPSVGALALVVCLALGSRSRRVQ